MIDKRVICMGVTPASDCAASCLRSEGWEVSSKPDRSVPHLLLDVPSFGPGRLEHPDSLLSVLPKETVIYGGNLRLPSAEDFRVVDFLKDEFYLAENAAITADCALQVAAPHLSCTFSNLPVLVIGWGRIGKCLGNRLKAMGANVTISARKVTDLAMLGALGYRFLHTHYLGETLPQYRLVFNTVPECVLDEGLSAFLKNCVKIDLASEKGIHGNDVVWARGLPGIHAPETSGRLIAKTFLRLVKEEA